MTIRKIEEDHWDTTSQRNVGMLKTIKSVLTERAARNLTIEWKNSIILTSIKPNFARPILSLEKNVITENSAPSLIPRVSFLWN